jgi:hypothetical protein
VDEILSSTKYALSARKTWTRDELKTATNVRIVKTPAAAKEPTKNTSLSPSPEQLSREECLKMLESPAKKRYNFPSAEDCLRRLGSPAVDRAKKSMKRDGVQMGAKRSLGERNESSGHCRDGEAAQEGKTRSSPRLMSSPTKSDNVLKDENIGNAKEARANNKPKRSSPRIRKSPKELTPDHELDTPQTKNIEIAQTSSCAKQSAAEATSKLIEANNSCMQGEKTAWEVVQLFSPLLGYLEQNGKPKDEKIIMDGLADFIMSVKSVKQKILNRHTNGEDGDSNKLSIEERLLRLLQIQIWIRIMVWNFNRENGWGMLQRVSELNKSESQGKSKGKRKKGKKKPSDSVSPRNSFVKDIISLFELVPYVLPPLMEFSQWLKDTLTFGFQQSIPEFGRDIFDHFEVEYVVNAQEPKMANLDISKPSKVETKLYVASAGSALNSKATTNGSERQQAFFSSLACKPLNVNADGESATIGSDASIARSHCTSGSSKALSDKEADSTLFKISLSLTAAVPKRKENPFLKGSARGVYVGSHFSSKLSNITSLFREVKAPPKPKPVVTAKRKNPPETDVVTMTPAANRPWSAQNDNIAQAASEKLLLPAKVTALPRLDQYNTTQQPFNAPSETPRKRLKPAPSKPSWHSNTTQQAFNAPAETPRPQRRLPPAPSNPNPSWPNNVNLPSMNNFVAATPLQIIGETPSKTPRPTSRRLRPNALDGIFVRHSVEMTPQPQRGENPRYGQVQNDAGGGGLCFGLSPMPQQRKNQR